MATAKKPVAKKTTAKKAPVKKTTAKKTTVKKTAATKPVVTEYVVAPVETPCACDKHCACGADCKCHGKCGGFWGFFKKLIIILIVFALGFAAAKLCCTGHNGKMRGFKPVFVGECLDLSSVKCPKMVEKLAAADVDGNGCITHEEYRAVKHHPKRK